MSVSQSSFLDKLNPQQKSAATALGTTLVIAGAGTGKTNIITSRIADLIINKQARPSSIVALTFTNKAAREMHDRIKTLISSYGTEQAFIGTFHGYCLHLLRRHYAHYKARTFTILDSDDQEKIIKLIIKEINITLPLTTSGIAHAISVAKNTSSLANKITERSFSHPLLFQIYNCYEREKVRNNLLDFDDLLLETIKVLSQENLNTEYTQHIKHVLVDEYQDTNHVQHELLKRIVFGENGVSSIETLCAVGDEDQSIYSWRGADVANMQRFVQDFSPVSRITVDQNYRSVPQILQTANDIIANNSERNPKQLWSAKKGTDRVRIVQCQSDYQEADVVFSFLHVHKKEYGNGTQAILYRTHAQSRIIEEKLIRGNISYQIVGATQFYERKEIKDLLAYLSLLVNPYDRISLLRVINTPTRGIGETCIEVIQEELREQPEKSCLEIIEQLLQSPLLQARWKHGLSSFFNLYAEAPKELTPDKALKYFVEKTDYIVHIKKMYTEEEATARIENVVELIKASFDTVLELPTVEEFLYNVTLFQEHGKKKRGNDDVVTLMTLHAAKGLEFDAVALVGLEDGLLPSSRSLQEEKGIEEERRLMYVGITRAKEFLLMSYAQERMMYGKHSYTTPSTFLKEIRTTLIKTNAQYWSRYESEHFFSQWLSPHSINTSPEKKSSTTHPQPFARKTRSLPAKGNHVTHKQYGLGIVMAVEQKTSEQTVVTVQFKEGARKILAHFLELA